MTLSNSSFINTILLLGLTCFMVNGCGAQDSGSGNFMGVEGHSAEVITSWNHLIFQTAIEEDGLLTLKGIRTAAMAHVAMHDALQAIRPKYQYYAYEGDTESADPIAAIASAAFEVLNEQYPGQKALFERELSRWLQNISDGKGKEEGIQLGSASAQSILSKRANDSWNSEVDYNWHPMGPGVYAEFNEHSGTPEGFVFGAGWAKSRPFMLQSQSQFRSPPPPEIKSNEYTTAFTEVREYGRTLSTSRTPDQEHLAMWAKDFVENSHNRLARTLVIKEDLDLYTSARAFALMNMSIYDAYVNVFDNKFHYNHWRPYTAIRWAAHDGNPDTDPDTTWNNLHQHTYAFPSYPSAHGTASAAAMTTLAQTLGFGDNYAFQMEIREVDEAGPFSEKVSMDPPMRHFSSFSEAAMAFSMSRIYLGIHFRYDSEEGNQLGTKIGNYGVMNFLKPL